MIRMDTSDLSGKLQSYIYFMWLSLRTEIFPRAADIRHGLLRSVNHRLDRRTYSIIFIVIVSLLAEVQCVRAEAM